MISGRSSSINFKFPSEYPTPDQQEEIVKKSMVPTATQATVDIPTPAIPEMEHVKLLRIINDETAPFEKRVSAHLHLQTTHGITTQFPKEK